MTITRDVLVDIMRTPDLKDKHAGFVGFEDIHNWTWCYDKSRLGGCNNVYSMQEVQRLYALGIPTETPEEKEVLDGIESTGEVEWKNGDECVISQKSKSKWLVVGVSPLTKTSTVCVSNTGELKSFHTEQLKKPETPQQREDRERLEAAYDLYLDFYQDYNPCHETIESFECSRDKDLWLRTVDKTNYRKEKTHATN